MFFVLLCRGGGLISFIWFEDSTFPQFLAPPPAFYTLLSYPMPHWSIQFAPVKLEVILDFLKAAVLYRFL